MLIFLLVWLLSAVYLGMNLRKNWDPADEGTLGQSAERVLHGEMPHRDFHDPYTGGLSYINAAIFKLFGVNLFWLRLFLFVCFLAWVPAVYGLASEFAPPWPAAGVTLIAVTWSVPNYPAAMPSWFNLFLTTFGLLALARYIRKPTVQSLFLAGLCGGLSFLIKSVASYYIAAALLFFVYREQSLSRNGNAPARRTPVYFTFLIVCLSIFVVALIRLVFAIGKFPEYMHFVFPGAAIAFLLAFRERKPPSVSDSFRFSALVRMVVPFLLAAAVPVILFSIFYWHQHALASLLNGLFVAPFRRLIAARVEPIGLLFEYPSVLAALLIVETAKLRGQPRLVLSIFLACLAALVLVASRSNDLAFIVGMTSALGLIPVIAVAAVLILSTQSVAQQNGAEGNQELLLLWAMATLFSLIQFPFSPPGLSPGYFGYIAPLVALLVAALLSRFAKPPRILLHAAVAFYLLFAVIVIHPHFLGGHHRPELDNIALTLPRAGGLRVTKTSAAEYTELIPFVQKLALGEPILAGPDCPEIYFLTSIKNPTPILYDSLEDPHTYEQSMQSLFDRPNFLRSVVINDMPGSAADQSRFLHSLAISHFSNSRKIGSFTVYWRD